MTFITAFNNVSIDGFFADETNDMSWAHNHKPDPEWQKYVASNSKGGGTLVFGRVTYNLMAGYWPTPMAEQSNPAMAKQMNEYSKIVFSRSLDKAAWNNTRLVKTGPVEEIKRLKKEAAGHLAILGSGTIITQLLEADLLDELTIVVNPIIIGQGKSIFATATKRSNLGFKTSRSFANGNVVLTYGRA